MMYIKATVSLFSSLYHIAEDKKTMCYSPVHGKETVPITSQNLCKSCLERLFDKNKRKSRIKPSEVLKGEAFLFQILTTKEFPVKRELYVFSPLEYQKVLKLIRKLPKGRIYAKYELIKLKPEDFDVINFDIHKLFPAKTFEEFKKYCKKRFLQVRN